MTNNQIMAQHSNFLKSEAVQRRLQEVVGKRSSQFATTLLSILRDNDMLANADTNSVMAAALKSTSLNLPIEPSLGFAYIVPFNNKKKRIVEAQFQLGYKGLIQLAQRSGKYKSITSGIVYKSQFISYDPLFEELKIDFTNPQDEVVGYFAAFELINGFRKVSYWTKKQAETHGKRFSKSFNYGPWKTDFDAMAQKTVLKQVISKYGPLSVEMEEAIVADNETEDMTKPPVDVTPTQEETLDDLLGASPEPTGDSQSDFKDNSDDLADQDLKSPTEADKGSDDIAEEVSLFEGDTTKVKDFKG